MLKDQVISSINAIMKNKFGFEAYVVCRDREDNSVRYLKKFILDDKSDNGMSFREKVCQNVKLSLEHKYCHDEALYAAAFDIANRQKDIYVIPQTEQYKPFAFLDTNTDDAFSVKLINEAEGLMFCFMCAVDGKMETLWAYQKFSNFTIPNKKKSFIQAVHNLTRNARESFVEFDKQLLLITDRIDLLVLNNDIITDNINLLERSYGFEEFIRTSAMSAVDALVESKLVKDDQKLKKYVQRTEKKYARKMMQIQQYPVIKMDGKSLVERMAEVDIWKNVFEIDNNQIVINNYKDVENLIDLLVERFTKSEISGQEYDTEVKRAIL